MNIYDIELNNDMKSIPERKRYIESLIAQANKPEV